MRNETVASDQTAETQRNPRGQQRRPSRGSRTETDAPLIVDPISVNATAVTDDNTTEQSAPKAKRSRDQYGRERKPRGERVERSSSDSAVIADVLTVAQTASPPSANEEDSPRKSYFISPDNAVTNVTVPVDPLPSAPSAMDTAMPTVQPYNLPLEALAQVVKPSGLIWVRSDAEKVAAAQAAIATEPKPVHVPRDRTPALRQDDRPLVLVETKRDLRTATLPFEESAPPTPEHQTTV
jgi:ribonuclease E